MLLTCWPSAVFNAYAANKLVSIEIKESELNLNTDTYGQREYKLNYTAEGENPSEPVTVSWRSTNSKVAKVNGGTVTAVGAGTCIIVAYQDGSDVMDTCTVYVRESISWKYTQIENIISSLPANWENTSVYSADSVKRVRNAINQVQKGLEDTPENVDMAQEWYDELYAAKAELLDSEIVSPDDPEFWAEWNKVYATIPDGYYKNEYSVESSQKVTDIIREVYGDNYSKIWFKKDADKLNALADELKKAIAGLKVKTTEIRLDSELLTKYVGCESFRIGYSADGEDEVKWESSDESVAKIDAYGNINIVGACPDAAYPYVVITVRAGDCSDTCRIKVNNPATGIRLSNGSVTIGQGDSQLLALEILGTDPDSSKPVTGAYKTTWTSSNPSVATVNSGIVTAVSPGSCKITVNFGEFTASCTVIVVTAVKVSKLTPSSIPMVVTVGGTTTATVIVYPKTASDKDVAWLSSDEKIVSVTNIGSDAVTSTASAAIRGVSPGEATITYKATDGSGISGSFKVTVSPMVSSVKLNKSELLVCIYDDEDISLTATVSPSDAGNQNLNWISSNEAVASVSSSAGSNNKGKISIKSVGTCTISAYSSDGSDVHGSCELRVVGAAKAMNMNYTSLDMKAGESVGLSCEVITGEGASYDVQKWESSDKTIASVGSSSGKVIAKKPGTVTITATSLDGKTAKCTIKITADVEGISLPDTLTLAIGKTKTLTPVFEPEFATNQKVKWKSSDSAVATVSSSGKITANAVGSATITVTSDDGGFVATCKVTVSKPVTGIEINHSRYTMTIGVKDTGKLKAKVFPDDATDKTVSWKSSKKSVVTVSSSGTIVAQGPGTATITVTSSDGGYKDTCKVTVIQPVKGIAFSKSTYNYYIGQQDPLKLVFTPSDASNKNVKWASSNKSVARVSSDGTVTGIKKGTCKITVKTEDGGYKATCTVKVNKKVDVTGVKLNKKSLTVEKGDTATLKATVSPSNASVQSVKWSTSDKSIATVNSKGVVTGKKGGTVTITCKTSDQGKKATCKVTVHESVTEVTLNVTKLTLLTSNTKTLTASVLPKTATNKSIKWYSGDSSIAKVSSKGKITPLKSGTVRITAKSRDNTSVKAVCVVTVQQAPEKISLTVPSSTIARGTKMKLAAKVGPSDTYDKSVEWSSNKRSVARVSSSGVVTAVAAGTATITCKSAVDGDVKKSCTITVTQPVTGLSLSATKLTLTTGKTKTLVASVKPSNATNKKVTFKSSDKSVATVTSKGLIEAVGPGTTTLTVTTKDGLYVAKCTVTVIEPVISVKLDRATKYLVLGKSFTLNEKIYPKNATNQTVKWKSSNSTVARVTQSGKVTALKEGTAYITVTSEDGNCKASCKVICVVGVDAVTLNKTSATLKKGKTLTLKASILPADATIKEVSWSSSNKKVAKVDSKGKVTAVGKGTAVITCKTKQGSYKAVCTVKVK